MVALAWSPVALAGPLHAPQYAPGLSGERDYLQVQGARLLAPARVAAGPRAGGGRRGLARRIVTGT